MDTITFQRKKVYDGVLRLLHAWNGLAILLLLITGLMHEPIRDLIGRQGLWQLHIYVGYGLIAGLILRAAWGVVGPEHARWRGFWHPKEWIEAVRSLRLFPKWGFGHHPLASATYLALYASLGIMSVTGLVLAAIEQGMGPLASSLFDTADPWKDLFEEPHEALAFAILGFVGLHMGALILHEWIDRRPVAQSMVSGYQYLPEEEEK